MEIILYLIPIVALILGAVLLLIFRNDSNKTSSLIDNAVTDTSVLYTTYDDGKISFEYPDGWTTEVKDGIIVCIKNPRWEYDYISINCMPKAKKYVPTANAKYYMEDVARQHKSGGYRISKKRVTTLKSPRGIEVAKASFSAKGIHDQLQYCEYDFILDHRFYSILTANYRGDTTIAEHVFDTLSRSTAPSVEASAGYETFDFGVVSFQYPDDMILSENEDGNFEMRSETSFIGLYYLYDNDVKELAENLKPSFASEQFSTPVVTEKINRNGIVITEVSVTANAQPAQWYQFVYLLQVKGHTFMIAVTEFNADKPLAKLVLDTLQEVE